MTKTTRTITIDLTDWFASQVGNSIRIYDRSDESGKQFRVITCPSNGQWGWNISEDGQGIDLTTYEGSI